MFIHITADDLLMLGGLTMVAWIFALAVRQ